jgi:hypothetical protein
MADCYYSLFMLVTTTMWGYDAAGWKHMNSYQDEENQ